MTTLWRESITKHLTLGVSLTVTRVPVANTKSTTRAMFAFELRSNPISAPLVNRIRPWSLSSTQGFEIVQQSPVAAADLVVRYSSSRRRQATGVP
jgi:hypothetical protein